MTRAACAAAFCVAFASAAAPAAADIPSGPSSAGGSRPADSPRGQDAASAREARFLELLRTYPSRPSAESVRLVSQLVDEGSFAERDRALFWLGSVELVAQHRPAARDFFARLRREYPASPWTQRAALGEGDACAQERRYGCALDWYERAAGAQDESVQELARLSQRSVRTLRAQQRWALFSALFAGGFCAAMIASIARHRGAGFRLLPLPAEVRVVLPVLAVVALLALRQDPAPRTAVLQICGAGAVLASLSAWRLRAVAGRLSRAEKVLHALGAVLAVAAVFWLSVYRAELTSLVLETLRAGAEQ